MKNSLPLTNLEERSQSYHKMREEVSTNGFRQFLVLLYKGLLLRKRHYIITALEIVFPIMMASIPVIIMSESFSRMNIKQGDIEKMRPTTWENASFYNPFDPLVADSKRYSEMFFLYAPQNDLTSAFLNASLKTWIDANYYGDEPKINIQGANTESELEARFFLIRQSYSYNLIIGTVFNSMENAKLPDSLNYKIRYGDWDNFYTDQKYRIKGPQKRNTYFESQFLSWQAAVERTFIDKKMEEKGKNTSYELSMNRFPYPAHDKTGQDAGAGVMVSLLIGYGYLVLVIFMVRSVTEEKKNRSKELLKMMGMKDFVYWTSTFTNYFSVGALTVLIISIIYKAPMKNSFVYFYNTDFFLLFFLLLLFMAQLILFCFAATTFFNRPVFAIILVLIIYNASLSTLFSIYFGSWNALNYFQLSTSAKLGICLLPSGALLTFLDMISTLEVNGIGARWRYLTEFNASFDVNMLMVIGMMIISCILYCIIIWYVDAVWPWQYGVPKPFYFPFTKSYWCCFENQVEEENFNKNITNDKELFEEEPTDTAIGVQIRNLSKTFQTGTGSLLAVNNVNLNIYNGQITALLGHNGAGKTTTINILTGLYTPSSGSASVNGWSILKDITKVRRSFGVCPQDNVLYDTLTVEEHLKIYAGLKGTKWSQLSFEAMEVLKILQLSDKKNELVKNLSGGMKRKLSLGIAMIGGSKVMILDEPTSGMDVEARRSVWDALLNLRQNRTIILTTHYMEEADVLGDRVAIMADGEIQCCGSPMFLKRKFGTGYHLHLVKDQNFNQDGVMGLIKKHIEGTIMENNSERQVTFNLGSHTDSLFAQLFEDLENSKAKLGVSSCGVTVTTMDDVFLKVSDANLKRTDADGALLKITRDRAAEGDYSQVMKAPKFVSPTQQLLGLLIKRFNHTKRHWTLFIQQILVPFLLLCACLGIISVSMYRYSRTVQPLELDIKKVYGDTDGFYEADESSQAFKKILQNVLEKNSISRHETKNATEYILKYGADDIVRYLKFFIFGGSVTSSKDTLVIKAWFNGEPYHALPMSLTLINTAILQRVTGTGSITLTNAPFPFYFESERANFDSTMTSILGMVFIPIALGYLTATFVMFPIQERASKAKLLQLMTGLHEALYWLSMFIWDGLIYIFISILLIIPFAIFDPSTFFYPHSNAIGTALFMMLLYGLSSIPFAYLISLIFKKPNTGYIVITLISVIAGTTVGSIILSVENVEPKIKPLAWVFRIFPSYCIGSGFARLFSVAYSNSFCDRVPLNILKQICDANKTDSSLFKCCFDSCGKSCLKQKSPLEWSDSACGPDVLFLALDAVLYISLLLLFESMLFKRFWLRFKTLFKRQRTSQIQQLTVSEDSDVLAEETRVRLAFESMTLRENDNVLVQDLSKMYTNFHAVDHLTFGIPRGECFGLLGVNGAGKTTTFRMLTGDCTPTSGNAFALNASLVTDLKKFQSYIGYCPQFNALLDRLTGREMISLFARLRGMSNIDKCVDMLIQMTDLSQHADKQTRFYSGGNKRKLSIAIALIGNPPLILLDEPTAGVDPVSRRKIWNILALARNITGAIVVLTTHSMEESEALCNRLAIMVNGRFQCIGSIQQLKSKFGQGYTLTIKIKREMQNNTVMKNELKNFVESRLGQAQLKDDQQGMLQYHVVNPNITLSHVFKCMDEAKPKFDLEDYLISDTSLEQIFLTFARAQRIQN